MSRYVLNDKQIELLMEYLEKWLRIHDCNHTLRHTISWIEENVSPDMQMAVLDEIRNGGGYCDCEVIFNCYCD